MCSTYDRSFHSFDELTDLLLRGGEIELLYKHTAYTIFPLFEENVITAIDVGIRPNYLEIPDPHQSILIYDWTPYPVDRISLSKAKSLETFCPCQQSDFDRIKEKS